MRLTADGLTAKTETALADLIEAFRASPTLFYTENDLACWMAARLNDFLGDDGVVPDKDGLRHRLVHTEYPTPFRGSTADGGFVVRTSEDSKRDGIRYRRGRLDLVVLNPEFVAAHTYAQLNGRSLARLQAEVFGTWTGPMLAFAVEFFVGRSFIKPGAVAGKVRAIRQDAAKLQAASQWNEFVSKTLHVAFFNGAGAAAEASIRGRIDEAEEGIRLVFAEAAPTRSAT